jgi:hypothetical protein
MWNPDEELLSTTRAVLGNELAVIATTAPRADDFSLLEAVGALAALDQGADAARRVATVANATDTLREQLRAAELPWLDEATVSVLELAPRALLLDPECVEEELLPLLQALRARDRAELAWLGAETLGLAGEFSDDASSARLAFDETAAEQLWQLVPLNDRRRLELGWLSPAHHDRFWWWSRGAELPANAINDPAQRAALLAVFPEARAHVEALDAAARGGARVISLLDRLRRRAPVEGDRLRAAATGVSRAVSADPDCDVSFEDPDQLVVDVIGVLATGRVPTLIDATGTSLEGKASPHAPSRFRFSLTGFRGASATLRLPLTTGEKTLSLP